MPWGIDIALVSQGFMFLGYQLRYKDILYKLQKSTSINILLFLIFIGLFIIVFYANERIDMNSRIYKNFLLFYIGGFSGSLIILYLSRMISNLETIKRFFITYGKETLIILVFHAVSFKVISALAFFVLHVNIKSAQHELWFIYFLAGIIFPKFLGIMFKDHILLRKVYYQK